MLKLFGKRPDDKLQHPISFVHFKELFLWGEEDSNLRRLSQQIYSLPRLTASVSPREFNIFNERASRGIRTHGLLITNQLL